MKFIYAFWLVLASLTALEAQTPQREAVKKLRDAQETARKGKVGDLAYLFQVVRDGVAADPACERPGIPCSTKEAAIDLLRAAVPHDPIALQWGSHPQAVTALPAAASTFLATFLGGAFGLAMTAQRLRPTWVTRVGLACTWLLVLAFVIFFIGLALDTLRPGSVME